MMMAMMLVASATAFAGDSDALKAILKAKDYAEAQSLINSSISQLTDAAEKAKAYNKLVDLACEKFDKEEKVKLTNAAMQKNDPVDTDGMIAAAKVALQGAMECDKFDQQPNEKGKVAPKFHDKNIARTKSMRLSLLQETEKLVNAQKSKEALEIFDLYIGTSKSDFFKDVDGVSKNDPNMGYAAFYGGQSAFRLEDYAKAKELYKVGIRDTNKQISEYSLEGVLQSMQRTVKSAADSTQYIAELIELNNEMPQYERIYAILSEAYLNKGDKAKVIALADERVAKYPDSSLPYVYKGILYMNDRKFDEAIAEYAKVKEDKSPIYLNAVFNSAVCKYNKASEFNEANTDMRTGKMSAANHEKFINMLKDAQIDFEKAKELDPEQKTMKWQYLLHNVYTLTGQTDKAAALE